MTSSEAERPSTIAIDGPAASGKSTIGYHLAQYLGYLFLDTGVLYRAVTWAVQHLGIDVDHEARITQVAEEASIDVLPPTITDGRTNTVLVDGRDVTWEIRSPTVEQAVSPVSAYPGVRAALTRRMREIARRGRVVMVGRDIGTVVIPEADLKLYVVASAEERARRRLLELCEKGKDVSYADVLAGIRRRDCIDSSRETAPLRAADDAIHLDTTDLSLQAMLVEVERLVNAGTHHRYAGTRR
ncbi:MAG: (d)CMP kinase [Anaerolineae bacterium]|nr:(d)CMP kinase [Anaerolineae bacterium]